MICKDLEIPKRTSKTYEVKFSRNGEVPNITGWTIYFTVKLNMNDSDAEAKIKKDVTPANPESGVVMIPLSVTDTDLPPKSYHYSVDYKDDLGNEGILATGRLKISKTVRDVRN